MEKLTINGLETVIENLTSQQQSLGSIIEVLKALQIRVQIPGLTAEDIELCLKGNQLSLTLSQRNPDKSQGEALAIIGNSAQVRTVAGLAEQMANRDEYVILQGETGTGKEYFARYIHNSGKRRQHPFIRFDGASPAEPGQLGKAMEMAANGTLYLTDIDELDNPGQQELLNLLEADSRCNSSRIIAATRNDLDTLVAAGLFPRALKELLGYCYIPLPPLRDRREDILPLAEYYLPILSGKISHAPKVMTPEYLQVLELYDWPGNVRELLNTLEQSLYSAGDKPTLFNKDLPTYIRIETADKAAAQKQGI